MDRSAWVVMTESEIYGIYSTRELAVSRAEENLICDEHKVKFQEPKDTDDWTYKKWVSECYDVTISKETFHEE